MGCLSFQWNTIARNQLWQIFWQLDKGFWFYMGSNFGILYWLRQLLLIQRCATVRLLFTVWKLFSQWCSSTSISSKQQCVSICSVERSVCSIAAGFQDSASTVFDVSRSCDVIQFTAWDFLQVLHWRFNPLSSAVCEILSLKHIWVAMVRVVVVFIDTMSIAVLVGLC